MADQSSVETLPMKFANRPKAYRTLLQCFSRSLSAFSSSIRECLNPVVKVDQFTQNADDIGSAANNALDLTRYIQNPISTSDNLNFLVGPSHREEFYLKTTKIKTSFANMVFQIEQLKLRFVRYYPNNIAWMVEKLDPFCKLKKAKTFINVKSDLMDSINKPLSGDCQLAPKQPLPEK